jgi:proline iminopeptidase
MTTLALFPPIEPFATHQLDVGDGHTLYVEQVGNPNGQAVVFLHGGPGSGCSPKHRQLFDPAHYHIILFDQRGAGRSTPHANLQANTTAHLVGDMERIRTQLGVNRWLVFGGSWGSTLALAYAVQHPQRVTGLIVRGIFLCRPEEIAWFYQEGCSWLYPEEWARYIAPIPSNERRDLLKAYHWRLNDGTEAEQLTLAQSWSRWEGAASKLVPSADNIAKFEDPHFALSMARIESHYFMNGAFFPSPNYLLEQAALHLQQTPMWIVHGRYDVICPVKNAVDLHNACPNSQLHIMPQAGHAYDEPETLANLLQATQAAKTLR